MLTNKTICFIGAGAMAEAMISGLINKNIVKPEAIRVTNRSDHFRLRELADRFGVAARPDQKEKFIREADLLILSMKPKDAPKAIEQIRSLTHPGQLVISVIAGITTSFISKALRHQAPVIRAMPNTSATIGQSATGVSPGATAGDEHLSIAKHIFEAIGEVAIVEESQLDAVTGLSGSGPAYIYYVAEAMMAGAAQAGLDPELAKKLTLQTIVGAAEMLKQTGEDPSVLRDKVTSPNGTTQAGLQTLRDYRFEEAIISCVLRATERARELGEELSSAKT